MTIEYGSKMEPVVVTLTSPVTVVSVPVYSDDGKHLLYNRITVTSKSYFIGG